MLEAPERVARMGVIVRPYGSQPPFAQLARETFRAVDRIERAPAVQRVTMEKRAQASRKWVRPLLLGLVLVALVLAGRLTGVTDGWTLASIRERVQHAGPLGFLLYVALFSIGELVHVPGMVFVGAGILSYGKVAGFFAALAGALVSVSTSFFVVRGIGGRAIAEIDRPFVKKMMARLDAKPVSTVAVLRCVLVLLPALNYALALSSIRYRSYLLGSLLGLLPPLLAAAVLFELFFA